MSKDIQLSKKILEYAESFSGIKAGIAVLEDVLQGYSYQSELSKDITKDVTLKWPDNAQSVLVIGLSHPSHSPELDWQRGIDTPGNQQLIRISKNIANWIQQELHLKAMQLPYHVEKGGLFLKDASVMAGLGVIGKNNLLVNPDFGSRIRLRSIIIEGKIKATGPLTDFQPCKTCEVDCQNVCPQNAFPKGKYSRPICKNQIDEDMKHKVSIGKSNENEKPKFVIKYCRKCELICPIGNDESSK